jgi:hypothetical protein
MAPGCVGKLSLFEGWPGGPGICQFFDDLVPCPVNSQGFGAGASCLANILDQTR